MNLYFLSLVLPTRKRTKTIALGYEIKNEICLLGVSLQENEYLKLRFPFLEVGDVIKCGSFTAVNGNYRKEPLAYINFPGIEIPGDRFYPSIIDRISKSKIQRGERVGNEEVGHFIIPKFKIGKTRYELICTFNDVDPMTEEHFVDLEGLIRGKSITFFYLLSLDEDGSTEIGDYFERFKKRLFLYWY
jgi:hypothetical protein